MSEHLPEFVDPLALADKRRRVSGVLSMERMPRLRQQVSNPEGSVLFELEFGKEGRYAIVKGKVQAEVALECQCCLAAMPLSVSSAISLAMVRSIDEANLLPEQYEPLVLDGDTIRLADIVEDELLLALPAIPQHKTCQPIDAGTAEPCLQPSEPRNPFAVLAEFKKSNSK